MERFIEVARAEDVPPGRVIEVEAEGEWLAVANVGGDVFVVDAECTHMTAPLSEGEVDESACTLECPLHGSVFDLRTGEPRQPPATEAVRTYEVRVEDGAIKVDVGDRG